MDESMASRVMEWARFVLAIFNLIVFGVALFMAFWRNDNATMSLLIGAVIANMTTVLSWFYGSSSSSQKKDDVIAGVAQTAVPTAPIAPEGKP